jgi:hypothetical protein
MKITKSELKEIIRGELEQVSEYGWDDLKVGDTVTMKNNKKAKVVKLGGRGFPRNFVKVKPSSGKEEVVPIDDLKESNQVSEAGMFGGGGGNAREIMDMKKAKKEMQSVQSVISDMTVLLDRLYQKFKPTDEAATEFPKGKLKSAKTSAVKAKRAIEAFSDTLYEQKLNEGMDKRQAGELIKQLGGGRFIAMTGAKDFVVGPKGATFKIGKNSKSISHVRIDLENDLYNVEFIRVRGTKITVVKNFKHVHFDQLRDLFEKNTGLRTSL